MDSVVEIVLQDSSPGRPKRSVTVTGSHQDVMELVGLYQLARQATRDRIKLNDFRRLVVEAQVE